jgi:hypothetical protein
MAGKLAMRVMELAMEQNTDCAMGVSINNVGQFK